MNKTVEKLALLALGISLTCGAFAQKSDGTVNSLVKADNAFAQKAVKSGAKEAYTAFATDDGIVFRPNPVNIKKYYATATDSQSMNWKPDFARLSRSRDWGVTSGTYEEGKDKFGHYLSVWRDEDGRWKCVVNLQTEAIRPIKGKELKQNFVEPKDTFKPKFATKKEIKSAAEIVSSTEKIMNTMFKTQGVLALAGFLNHDVRLLFPGTDVLLGKDDVLAFYNRSVDKINLKTSQFDRALGGELAYTYGLATIDYKTDLRESFNYIFVWERQTDGNWNIIEQIYILAER